MHDKVIVICLANVFFPTPEFLHSNYKAISVFFKISTEVPNMSFLKAIFKEKKKKVKILLKGSTGE